MQDQDKIAVRDERFNDFVRLRSITRVARLHGVSTQAIRKQAQAGDWKARALELDRANAISRKVVASQRTLEKLDRIEEVIEAELDALEKPNEDRDDLKRAGLATAVLTEAAKAKREAMAYLPEEPEPELNLSPLSNAAFAVWLAQGQLAAALKAARTGPYVAPTRGESGDHRLAGERRGPRVPSGVRLRARPRATDDRARMTSDARGLVTLAPLLLMGGTDPSADEYLAGIASRATGGVDSKAVREARRCLEWLAYYAAGTPRPRMAALVGVAPKLPVRLSACPWSRIDANVAAALRERIYANVSAGPKQDRRVRGYRGDDGTRRPLEARPRGHGAAQQKVHHLRAVLRVAVESG